VVTVVVTHCGYRGSHALWLLWCCFLLRVYNEQSNYGSVNTTNLLSRRLMLLPQHVSAIRPSSGGIQKLKTVYYRIPLVDGRMTETCCGSNIGRQEKRFIALADP
jgi:hypothetical protein